MLKKITKLLKSTPQKEKQSLIIFSHIPKTAGTSFRQSLEKSFNVLNDYGLQAKETSGLINDTIYLSKDPYQLKNSEEIARAEWLCGHFPLIKYVDLVNITNTISFVREPVEQVLSHYNHHVKHKNFAGTLDDFIHTRSWQNMQSNYLNAAPIGLLGCIGVTERFQDSLNIINQLHGTEIYETVKNVNSSKKISTSQLSEELRHEIISLNKDDLLLYQKANNYLNQKIEFSKTNELDKWVYSNIEMQTNGVFYGCAFKKNSNSPITIEIFKNGKKINEVIANQYYTKFSKVNFPRDRYIGFYYTPPEKMRPEEKYDFKVVETGQLLDSLST